MTNTATPPARTILLVDDEEDLRVVLQDVLATAGYRVVGVANGADAIHQHARIHPDLVILDLMLPDLSGFEVCKKIKSQVKGYLPIILLTARADLDSLVDGLEEAAADDYIVKPFRHRELLARILAALRIKDLHDVVQRQNDLLTELSVTDDLTGLYNRRYLTRKLDERIEQVRRTGATLSCALLDLDHFKEVNDAFGHLAGDEVLRRFAELLKHTLSPRDICGRWGGDEFLTIFSEAVSKDSDGRLEESRLRGWSDQIRAAVEKEAQDPGSVLSPAGSGGSPTNPIGVSAGVATVKGPDESIDPVQLMSDLDGLLYQAKQNGKNQFVHAKFDTAGRAPARRGQPAKKAGHRPAIFVLEDDSDICSIIRDMLSRHPVDTHLFQETPKLMEALHRQVPDLILLDLKLSDADGLDVCRQIRGRADLAGTKICFLTAFPSDEIKEKAMSCGADAYLVKPFTYSKFVEQVSRILDLKA